MGDIAQFFPPSDGATIRRGRVGANVPGSTSTGLTVAVVFDEPMPNANYTVVMSTEQTANVSTANAGTNVFTRPEVFDKTAAGFNVQLGNSAAAQIPAVIHYIAYAD